MPCPYVVRKLEQGSPEWRAWRSEGIGASDAPVVMGDSKWKTLEALLVEKLSVEDEDEPNAAMLRGRVMEPEARGAYIRRTGVTVVPLCLESRDRPWLRASLDGISGDGKTVVEIKCPGKVDHACATRGQAPPKYNAQLQHILAVTGLPSIDYWSYRDGAGKLLCVPRNDAYIGKLLARESEFWRRVEQARPSIAAGGPPKRRPSESSRAQSRVPHAPPAASTRRAPARAQALGRPTAATQPGAMPLAGASAPPVGKSGNRWGWVVWLFLLGALVLLWVTRG